MVKEFITKNGLQLAIYLISITGVMVGLYSAIRNDILSLSFRVRAIEERNLTRDPLLERFLKLEQKTESLIEDSKEIKEDVKTLKNYWNIK